MTGLLIFLASLVAAPDPMFAAAQSAATPAAPVERTATPPGRRGVTTWFDVDVEPSGECVRDGRTAPAELLSAAIRWDVPVQWACHVTWCESRWTLDPQTNRSYASGWQIAIRYWLAPNRAGMPTAADVRASWDTATSVARVVIDEQGPRAWSCHPGWYR